MEGQLFKLNKEIKTPIKKKEEEIKLDLNSGQLINITISNHGLNQTVVYPSSCSVCKIKINKESMTEHYKLHSKSHAPCPKCNVLITKQGLKGHLKQKLDCTIKSTFVTCAICGKEIVPINWNRHQKRHEKKVEEGKLNLFQKMADTNNKLRNGVKRKCQFCYTVILKKNMAAHMSYKHPQRKETFNEAFEQDRINKRIKWDKMSFQFELDHLNLLKKVKLGKITQSGYLVKKARLDRHIFAQKMKHMPMDLEKLRYGLPLITITKKDALKNRRLRRKNKIKNRQRKRLIINKGAREARRFFNTYHIDSQRI